MGKFSCVFFVLFAAAALAQTAIPRKLSGKVRTNFGTPEGFYVINLKTEQAEMTDDGGYFSVLATVGDTLLFSAAQFRRTRIVLTVDDFVEKLFSVQMEPIMNQLNEVVIRRYNNINSVSLGIIPSNQKSYTAAERKYATASSSRLNPMGLDPLLNFISGRTTMLKKELVVERKETYLAMLDNIFDENHFVKKLNIPLAYVKGFEYYAVENEKFTKILSSKNVLSTEFLLAELATKYNEIIACENE
ncbi:hypothetical protein [Flavobacterium sp. W22_SRS_FP1]|uniref:hypothetical protein n=1 Tax=Flavobacterium sp. W22_SRS_FP1 TaxID=3240276 RepID=UPI003F8F8709